MALGSREWIEVADDLTSANGIGVSGPEDALCQRNGRQLHLKFSIGDDGSRAIDQLRPPELTKNKVDSWWIDPTA
jgi:hypothetical protein